MTDTDFTLNPFQDDKLKDECGVFGIYNHADAAAHTALGLHALQHRGQESAGIISINGGDRFSSHRAMGLVGDIFGSEAVIDKLKGTHAIGHVRYSTTGESIIQNIQPLMAALDLGEFALAHNGNLTNAQTLRQALINEGAIFQSTTDTEVILHLVARSKKKTIAEKLIEALNEVKGAYSLVAMTKNEVIAVRDPHGVRPLAMGRLGDSYLFASETCAFDIIAANYVRDVKPGEMVIVDKNGERSLSISKSETKPRFCIFEYIYFARPDSLVDNRNVYEKRKAIGAELAHESPVAADLVVPVPDSGVPAAIGYAEAAKIPYGLGIIRNHYVGRTFIEPTDNIRHLGVKLKHNANSALVKDKRVILVDDSIVRGTTSKKIVEMVRNAGAKEVHMRISSPPTINSCFYGVDTPDRSKLIAANKSVDEIAKFIGADSLSFISMNGLYKAVIGEKRNPKSPQFCDACFTGDYPIELVDPNIKGCS